MGFEFDLVTGLVCGSRADSMPLTNVCFAVPTMISCRHSTPILRLAALRVEHPVLWAAAALMALEQAGALAWLDRTLGSPW